MAATIHIADRAVGAGAPCLVIAEIGVNHNGDLGLAREMITAAAQAGADAVKFQTFEARRLAVAGAPKAAYQKTTTSPEESQLEMLERLELSATDHRQLMDHARAAGLIFLSSPFGPEAADLLDDLGVAAFKIPSGELVDPGYLGHIAAKGRPMIVSTGMADLAEVAAAMKVIEAAGAPPVVLLHCLSNYPADPAEANLRAMATLAAAFQVPVGYSDHTPGNAVALAAVALGAAVLEKHFTLDRNLPGPDHRASLEPAAFQALVEGVRTVEAALGDGIKRPVASELGTRAVARKSLVTARALPAGTRLTDADIAIKRPGSGLAPALKPYLIGRVAKRALAADELLDLDQLS